MKTYLWVFLGCLSFTQTQLGLSPMSYVLIMQQRKNAEDGALQKLKSLTQDVQILLEQSKLSEQDVQDVNAVAQQKIDKAKEQFGSDKIETLLGYIKENQVCTRGPIINA